MAATDTTDEPKAPRTKSTTPTHGDPIILDLGRKKRKLVRELRDGEGKLLTEVMEAIEELKTAGTIAQSAQPVIVIVREKPKSMRFPLGL
jgi:hypothetical protein